MDIIRIRTAVLILVVLLVAGCDNKDDKLVEGFGKKADAAIAAKDMKALIALNDEVSNFVRWHEEHHKPLTADQVAKIEALKTKMVKEGAKIGWNAASGKVQEAVDKTIDALKKIPVKKILRVVSGVDDPRYKKYAGPHREPTDQRGAKGWP